MKKKVLTLLVLANITVVSSLPSLAEKSTPDAYKLLTLGKPKEAEAAFRTSLRALEEARQKNDEEIAREMLGLANALIAQGKHQEAREQLRAAMGLASQSKLASSLAIEIEHKYLEVQLLQDRPLSDPEEASQASFSLGSDRLELLRKAASGNVDVNTLNLTDKSELEYVYKTALINAEKAGGADSPVVWQKHADLAKLYLQQQRFSEASFLAREMSRIFEKLDISQQRVLAVQVIEMARTFDQHRRNFDASTMVGVIITAVSQQKYDDDPTLRTSLLALARNRMQQRRFAEAESAYKGVLAMAERSGKSDEPGLADVRLRLAEALKAQGRDGAAEELYRLGLFSQGGDRVSFGIDVRAKQDGYFDLIKLQLKRKNYDGAAGLIPALMATLDPSERGYDLNTLSRKLFELAIGFAEAGKLTETRTLANSVFAMPTLGDSYYYYRARGVTNLDELARVVETVSGVAEAEKFYLDQVEQTKKANSSDPSICFAYLDLARFYYTHDQVAKGHDAIKAISEVTKGRRLDRITDEQIFSKLSDLCVEKKSYGDAEIILRMLIDTRKGDRQYLDRNARAMAKLATVFYNNGKKAEGAALTSELIGMINIAGRKDVQQYFHRAVRIFDEKRSYDNLEKLMYMASTTRLFSGMRLTSPGMVASMVASSIETDNPKEADKMYQEALSIERGENKGRDNSTLRGILSRYGSFLQRQNREKEAAAVFMEFERTASNRN